MSTEVEEVADWMGIWYGEVMVYISQKTLFQARAIFHDESDYVKNTDAYLVKVITKYVY